MPDGRPLSTSRLMPTSSLEQGRGGGAMAAVVVGWPRRGAGRRVTARDVPAVRDPRTLGCTGRVAARDAVRLSAASAVARFSAASARRSAAPAASRTAVISPAIDCKRARASLRPAWARSSSDFARLSSACASLRALASLNARSRSKPVDDWSWPSSTLARFESACAACTASSRRLIEACALAVADLASSASDWARVASDWAFSTSTSSFWRSRASFAICSRIVEISFCSRSRDSRSSAISFFCSFSEALACWAAFCWPAQCLDLLL